MWKQARDIRAGFSVGKACRREVGRDELLSYCGKVVNGQRSGQAHLAGACYTFSLTTSERRRLASFDGFSSGV
jgi:hypothetical protein